MPNVYQSGEYIPEFRGAVDGGTTVVIHDPGDVLKLQAICVLAGQPPEPPMHAIYKALNVPNLNLDHWKMWLERRHATVPRWDQERPATETEETSPPGVSEDPSETLGVTLSLAHHVWTKDAEDAGQLCIALSMPDPLSSSYPTLDMKMETPSLMLHQGSLISKVVMGTIRPPGFAVSVLLGGGATATRRAERIQEALRERFQEDKNIEQLPDIRTLNAKNRKGKKGFVVFIHGLLSTDLGTFDELVRSLREDNNIVMAGFPHDTLTTIRTNGFELAEILQAICPPAGPAVAFICHSRGGLVARQAAVNLYKADDSWKTRVRLCVTFGTPHKGALLAESPDDLVGLFVITAAAAGTRSVSSLKDLLLYRSLAKGFPGIEDLRPRGRGGEFLEALEEAETVKRQLPIRAYGGRVRPQGVVAKLVERVLGLTDHDLVVETRSTLPLFIPESDRIPMHCNHFSYLKAMGENELGAVKQVIRSAIVGKQALQP